MSAPTDSAAELALLRARLADLERENERLHALVCATPIALVAVDPAGLVREWNPWAERLFGWRRDEVLGRPMPNPYLPLDAGDPLVRPPTLPAGMEPVRRHTKDGRVLDIAEVRERLPGGAGVLFTSRDITQSRRTSDELRMNAERFSLMAEYAADGFIRMELEPAARIAFVSGAIVRLSGYTIAQWLGEPELAAKLCHPDDVAERARFLRESLDHPTAIVWRWVRADGRILWCEHRGWPVRDTEGRTVAIDGIVRDVTDRVEAERARAQSERLAEATLEALAARVAILDEHGRLVAANPAWVRFQQERGEQQVVGRPYLAWLRGWAATGQRDALRFVQAFEELVAGRASSAKQETSLPTPSGDRWFTTSLARIAGPGPLRVVVAHEEITSLKHAQERLALLSSVVEHTDDIVVIRDGERRIEYVNPAFTRVLGYTLEELVGRPVDTIPSERGQEAVDGRVFARVKTRAGETKEVETAYTPIHSEDGRLLHMVHTARDVTARRRSEQQLKESEERMRMLLEMSSDVISILDEKGLTRYQSPSARRILGREPDERLGESALALVHPEDLPRVQEKFFRLVRDEGAVDFAVYRVRHGDGSWRVVESVGRNLFADPLIRGVVLNSRDITETHAAQEALRKSEHGFRTLIERQPDALCVHRSGRIVYVNAACETLIRKPASQLLGSNVFDHVVPEERAEARERLREAAALGQVLPLREASFLGGDGTIVLAEATSLPLDFDGSPALVTIMRDITERKQLQARLLLADRMVSVGTLAAGVAHEINNPLAFAAMNVGWAKDELQRWSEQASGERPLLVAPRPLANVVDALKEAQDGCQRVRQIVRDLKTFSRADEETRGPVDLRRVVERSIGLAWNEIRHRAQLVKAFQDVPPIEGNEARLGQVFLNLLVNAAQAMPEGEADRHQIRVVIRPDAAGQMAVEVHDTGGGIAPDVLARIFDPFYTTKPVGVGTGLGLSICHSIVTAHGGSIEVRSGEGRGTAFVVRLPVGAATVEAPPAPAPRPLAPRSSLLMVDDEVQLGQALRRAFDGEHEVVQEPDARVALRRLAQGETFDLVLCDLMMPHMTGMDLYAEVQRQAPAMAERFVFVTGGAFTPASRAFLDRVSNPRLEKPFDPEDVRAILRHRARG